MRPLALLAAVVAFAITAPAFAQGFGIFGHGQATTSNGGVGRPTSDGLSSLNGTNGSHPGGLGVAPSVSSNSLNRSTTESYNTAGVVIKITSGKGRGTETGVSQKAPTVQSTRGIGIITAAPGGRGL